MATITNYFEQAQLSMAAYASLQSGMFGKDYPGYVAALVDKGMSPKQAEEFANTYSVVYQSPGNDPSGFSATVFADSAGNKYFAIRGSEGNSTDWIGTNFGDIGLDGIAVKQGLALFNYLQRLLTPAGQLAPQAQYVPPIYETDEFTGAITLISPASIEPATSTPGLGILSPTDVVTVAGHSLGGHLAMIMSRLAPDMVWETFTYNAPGFSDTAGLTSSSFFNLLINSGVIPVTGAIGTDWDSSVINGLNVEGDLAHALPGYYTPGAQQIIFSESANQGIYDAHLKEPITDSLAIYSLLATLDPALNTNPAVGMRKITGILEAAAGTPGKSLENALDSLRTLFQQNYANSTADTSASPTFTDRNDFYTKLYALQGYLKDTPFYNTVTQSFNLTVDKLTDKGVSALSSAAQTDLATRYALYKLNPFIVKGAGLYEAINADHSLDHYDATTGSGALTDEYLKDRASFLYNKIQANNKDHDIVSDATTLATSWVQYAGQPQYFEDRSNSLPYKLYLGSDASIVNQPINGMSQIKFGGASTDTLTGGDKWDKLYGMQGDDGLNGGKGNDYLEGGQGADTYLYTSGDGLDTILDTDGLGKITFDGTILNGGKLLFGETYKSDDGKYLYTLLAKANGQDLLISAMGGQIIVKDFQSGELGIALNPADALAPAQNILYGDQSQPGQNDYLDAASATDTVYGLGGDDVLSGHAGEIGYVPTVQLYGGTGNDILHGEYFYTGQYYFLGSANFQTQYGDEVTLTGEGASLHGEAGRDTLLGSLLADTLDGGLDSDYLEGALGNDTFLGSAGNDIENGNEGRDALDGDDGIDRLGGGAGADILMGGADTDYLYGDSDWFQPVPWDGVNYTLLTGTIVGDVQVIPIVKDAPEADAGDDVLLGDTGDDWLYGGAGKDFLDGGAENDRLQGEGGDDTLFGGDGDDKLWGDSAADAEDTDSQLLPGDYGTYTYYWRERHTGPNGDDYLDGGASDDRLWGGGGNDHLLGGAGNDFLHGGLYDGSASGNDVLEGGAGADSLFGEDGDDDLNGGDDNDFLSGDLGNDTLNGGAGDDILRGGAGNDIVDGGGGNDTFILDVNADTLLNTGGDNIYRLDLNPNMPNIGAIDFTIDIQDTGGRDTLKLERINIGPNPFGGYFFRTPVVTGVTFGANELLLNVWLRSDIYNSPDLRGQIRIKDQFTGGGIERFETVDNSLTLQQLVALYGPALNITGTDAADILYGGNKNDTLSGGLGNDTLDGQGGNDVLNGGEDNDILNGGVGDDTLDGQSGNDVLNGGDGNDTLGGGEGNDNLTGGVGTDTLNGGMGNDIYQFNRGYGHDTIQETGGTDSVYLQAGIKPSNVFLTQAGSDLEVLVIGTSDNLTLQNWFSSPDSLTEYFQFTDGTVWDESEIRQRLGRFVDGSVGAETLTGTSVPEWIRGLAGNDQISGTSGNDVLEGGSGNDTYFFNLGDGLDVILDSWSSLEPNTVRFGDGITPDSVRLSVESNGLRIHVGNQSDAIDMPNFNPQNVYGPHAVDIFQFSNGVTMTYRDLINKGLDIFGTDASETIYGTNAPNNISAGGGDDVVWGGNGNDVLDGGPGNDKLGGLYGSDTYVFTPGHGHDVILDYDGTSETIQFGAGISPADIRVTHSTLYNIPALSLVAGLDLTNTVTGDVVNIRNWGPYYSGGNTRWRVTFADGTVWDPATLASLTVVSPFTENADVVTGTHRNDIIYGGEGNDLLIGLFGNDTFNGGPGNDWLYDRWGTENVYWISRGGGFDTVDDKGYYAQNVMRFGEGITPQNIKVHAYVASLDDEQFGPQLTIDIGQGEGAEILGKSAYDLWELPEGLDSIDVYDPKHYSIKNFVFANGQTLGLTQFLALDKENPYRPLTTDGNDIVGGGVQDDVIDALGGDDVVNADAGNDTITGGTGNDTLTGGTGNDTYIFNPGDGVDTIDDLSATGEGNTIQFGAGIDPAALMLSFDANVLVINLGGGDQLRLTNFDPNDVYGARAVETFTFADGTVLSYSQLIDRGFDLVGTTGDDVIQGTNGVDRIIGGDGNDTIIGGGGNDIIDGGAGNDTLYGNAGGDTYVFDVGNGTDTIYDNIGEANTLVFGSGVDPASVTLNLGSLFLNLGNGEGIHLEGFDPNDAENTGVIGTFSFADGTVLSYPDLLARGFDIAGTDGNDILTGTSVTDRISGGLGNDTINGRAGNDTYYYAIGDGTDSITDTAGADTLVLGSGISLDDLHTAIAGDDLIVGSGENTYFTIAGWGQGTDNRIESFVFADGTTYDAAFMQAWGYAPILQTAIADLITDEDVLFNYDLAGNFFDQDGNNTLAYSAALENGSALPGWLGLDSTTGLLTGTPLNEDVGALVLRVTATDTVGRSVSDTFTLTVNNVNDAPVVVTPVTDQVTDEDAPYSFTLDTATFSDDDSIHGDILTLSATLTDSSLLPNWLTFDATTGTFTGTPDNWQVGSYDIRVTATDLVGTSASDVFSLTVNNVNDNPVLANALNDLATDEDTPFNFTVPTNTFDDDDFIHGDNLTLSATLADGTDLPTWLSFDAATGTFTGTPDNWQVGSYDICVTATDTAGTSVSDVFTLTVNNVNDAPVLANAIPDQLATEGMAFNYTLSGDTFQDDDAIHGDVLSYTASLTDGSALPSWLTFDAATQTLTGTAAVDSVLTGTDGDDVLVDTDTGISGTWDIKVTATDTSGVSAEDTFTLTLQGVAGNDTLQGGKGNDLLNGGGGNDTYVYNAGDGLDTLTDREGQDTVSFGNDINFDNTVIRTEGGVAHLRFLDACGCETEEGMDIALNPDGSSPIETFAFADGSSYTLTDLTIQQMTWYGDKKANTIITGRHDDTIYAGKGGDTVYASSGHDTLYGEKGNDKLYGEGGNDALYGDKGNDYLDGGCGNDILDGGKGHNTLIGGEGNDTLILGKDGENTILFNLGDGWDTLKTATKDCGHDNEIEFGDGITPDKLWFERVANDLRISILGTNDGMTVEGWYLNKHRPLEEIETANGYELEDKKIELLVQAMAAFSPLPGSGNVLPTEMPQELQATLAAAWEPSHG